MVFPFDTITKSAEETQKLGTEFGRLFLKKRVSERTRITCLWGALGSGKTTYTQGVAKGLGITTRLLSPTYIIVRRYDVPKTSFMFFHIDLYRMENHEDIKSLGFLEICNNPNALVFVEWPERLGSFLPSKRVDVRFRVSLNGDHHITGNVQKKSA